MTIREYSVVSDPIEKQAPCLALERSVGLRTELFYQQNGTIAEQTPKAPKILVKRQDCLLCYNLMQRSDLVYPNTLEGKSEMDFPLILVEKESNE